MLLLVLQLSCPPRLLGVVILLQLSRVARLMPVSVMHHLLLCLLIPLHGRLVGGVLALVLLGQPLVRVLLMRRVLLQHLLLLLLLLLPWVRLLVLQLQALLQRQLVLLLQTPLAAQAWL